MSDIIWGFRSVGRFSVGSPLVLRFSPTLLRHQWWVFWGRHVSATSWASCLLSIRLSRHQHVACSWQADALPAAKQPSAALATGWPHFWGCAPGLNGFTIEVQMEVGCRAPMTWLLVLAELQPLRTTGRHGGWEKNDHHSVKCSNISLCLLAERLFALSSRLVPQPVKCVWSVTTSCSVHPQSVYGL